MGLVTYCERCGKDSRPHDSYRKQPCRACLEAKLGGLRAILSAEVGGERHGDTLIRLAGELKSCRTRKHVTTDDWRQWLREFGARLNRAAEAESEGSDVGKGD